MKLEKLTRRKRHPGRIFLAVIVGGLFSTVIMMLMVYVPGAFDFEPVVIAVLWAFITCVIGFCALFAWPIAVILKRDGPVGAAVVAALCTFVIMYWMSASFGGDYSGTRPPKSAAFISALSHAAVAVVTGIVMWITAYLGVENEDG